MRPGKEHVWSGKGRNLSLVALTDRIRPAPAHWPSVAKLEELAAGGALVMLPDRVDELDCEMRASFRDEAQAVRVAAQEQGLEVVLAVPPGARPALLREHDASLVLGAVLSVPTGVAAVVLANEIQRHLDKWRGGREAAGRQDADRRSSFTVRALEVVIKDDEARVREIEGPAEEVIKLLRAEAEAPGEPGAGQLE
jgi:hypothetical protein